MNTDNSTVSCSLEGSVLIVEVIPEQLRDVIVVQSLREGMIAAIEQTKVKHVVVDLSRVKNLGSVAFLAFLAIRRQSGIDRIVLCGLSEFVQELFQMCKLIASPGAKSAPFEQAATRQEAIDMCEA